MAKKKKGFLKGNLTSVLLVAAFIGIVFLGSELMGLTNFLQSQVTTPETPGENYYDVDATISFTVADLLAGSSVSGTLDIYDPNDPGVKLDAVTISSGTGTSTQKFHSSRILGVQFNGTASYYAYSWEITVPTATSNELTTVPYATVLKVLASADYTADTDFDVFADGTNVWDGSAAAVDAFKPDTDDDPELMFQMVQEDGNEGYGYPTIWHDYSTVTPGMQDRGSYVVIEFALNASGTTMTNVNDYLKFQDLGGMEKYSWGTSVFLMKHMNSEYLCGFNDDDDEGNTENGLTGRVIALTIQFDFDGAISGTAWSDEILIQITFFANWCQDYALAQETLSQTGDTPIGWEGSHFGAADRLTMG